MEAGLQNVGKYFINGGVEEMQVARRPIILTRAVSLRVEGGGWRVDTAGHPTIH